MSRVPRSEHKRAIPVPLPSRRERGVWFVAALTAVTMCVEISVGYATGSMALLADGWHMATHVAALAFSSLAYVISRRYAGHRAFPFGTAKIGALAGYTSAIVLGLVAVFMLIESTTRLVVAEAIDFATSLPVATIGLLVNLVSVFALHTHDDSNHDEHDHNHRAALLHVLADALTSALAIVALIGGQHWGWNWMDPLTGIVGAVVIITWGYDLARHATFDLLDLLPLDGLENEVRATLERIDDVRVLDLCVWSTGSNARSCMVTLLSAQPREPGAYHDELRHLGLRQLAVEVRRR